MWEDISEFLCQENFKVSLDVIVSYSAEQQKSLYNSFLSHTVLKNEFKKVSPSQS